MTPFTIEKVKEALDCTIEHLEGEHEGKVVVSRETFDTLYECGERFVALAEALPEPMIVPIHLRGDGEKAHNRLLSRVRSIMFEGE